MTLTIDILTVFYVVVFGGMAVLFVASML